ncbi:hypothetical protein [Flavobacterium sp. 3HN19-14]
MKLINYAGQILFAGDSAKCDQYVYFSKEMREARKRKPSVTELDTVTKS